MTDGVDTGNVCWGDHRIDSGRAGHWQVGPYEFWLARTESEWRFAGRQDDAAVESRLEHEMCAADEVPEDGFALQRLGMGRTSDAIRLTPMLADRSLVISPALPIALPPRQELVLYCGSPVWLKVEVDTPLIEFYQTPLQRPSDTWFGSNTREGEICYAMRTRAHLQRAYIPERPHRAMTELHVVNKSRELLPVDRIRVPLPAMTLFATAAGQLWTSELIYEHHSNVELAKLKLTDRPPSHTTQAEVVAPPRETLPRNTVMRAFGGLIGGR